MEQSTDQSNQTSQQQSYVQPTPPVVQKRQSNKGLRILAVIAVILMCFGGGFAGTVAANRLANGGSLTDLTRTAGDGNAVVTGEEADISSVAKKVSPSVVSIVTEVSGQSVYGRSYTQEGAGSGVIVSKDGYILTNKHVVSGAKTVSVITADGTTYENVTVVGTDPLNDIAFLKINNVSNLTAAELGDSSTIRIGQQVVAIGNSLGQYQNTVTSGIISALGRPVTAQDGNTTETLNDLLQTDAAINPGNSGGPLVNVTGQVIGINTAVAKDAQGIGFSIPINSTKGLLKNLLATGKVERAFLGVNYIPVTANVAKTYNLSVKQGAYVFAENNANAIVSDGPAAKAGVQSGDIITKVNDRDVTTAVGVASLVAEYAPGDTVKLTILRGGKTISLDVTLAVYSAR